MPNQLICEWCSRKFDRPGLRGPTPRFCSASHRQRAFEWRRDQTQEIEIERLREALALIAGEGCDNYTNGPGACLVNRPNGRGHQYGAEAWCDACVAFDVLREPEMLDA